MRLHCHDRNTAIYVGVSRLSILPLPVSLPVGACFVPESRFPVVTENLPDSIRYCGPQLLAVGIDYWMALPEHFLKYYRVFKLLLI